MRTRLFLLAVPLAALTFGAAHLSLNSPSDAPHRILSRPIAKVGAGLLLPDIQGLFASLNTPPVEVGQEPPPTTQPPPPTPPPPPPPPPTRYADAAECTRAHEGWYTANTGNGYYGAYQFLPSTWNNTVRAMGRDDLVGVLPSDASPADQDAAFWFLWANGAGSSHWGGRCREYITP